MGAEPTVSFMGRAWMVWVPQFFRLSTHQKMLTWLNQPKDRLPPPQTVSSFPCTPDPLLVCTGTEEAASGSGTS